jgi:XTP/dITP diphosphohydrolase
MNRPTALELLLATRNSGKVAEISAALGDLPIMLRTLDDFHEVQTVEEGGSSYEENAVIKAKDYARQTGLWALADDSGLEVDGLDGSPGIFSARYGGKGASDADRVALLLEQLDTGSPLSRKARFVCVIAVCDSGSRIIAVEHGLCEGTIAHTPRGDNGFGYDPIFVPQGFQATFAELPSHTKDRISHRGKALSAVHQVLARFVASGSTTP